MKKSYLLFVLFSLACSINLLAQEAPKPTHKKVIIIKTIDKDGNIVTKEIIDGEIDIEGMNLDNIDIEIKGIEDLVEQELKAVKIQIQDSEEALENIEWITEEQLEKGVLKELKDIDIQVDCFLEDTDVQFSFDCDEDKPFLGVVGKFVHRSDDPKTVHEAAIDRVVPGSAAEEAGLQAGDIITKIDNKKINSFSDISAALRDKNIGDQVSIKYTRDGKKKKAKATLNKRAKTDCKIIKIGDCHQQFISEEEIENGEFYQAIEIEENDNLRALELTEIDLYPNPTDGVVNLRFQAEDAPATISVRDIHGNVLHTEKLASKGGSFDTVLNLEGKAKGSVILQIEQNGKVHAERIILQ